MANEPDAPQAISVEFGRRLRLTKGQFLALAGEGQILQTGGAYIGDRFAVPGLEPARAVVEPMIETFVIEGDGSSCTAMGTDRELIDGWLPIVRALAVTTLEGLDAVGVTVVEPVFVTASVTPLAQVTTIAHVDDDQFIAPDGVGVVAIAASHGGPRLASGAIAHRPARPSLPLEIDPAAMASFERAGMPIQQASPDRIVAFPQFGQLHAGPHLEPVTASGVRNLLVLRAATQPDQPG